MRSLPETDEDDQDAVQRVLSLYLPLEVAKHLSVAQEFAKIDVEEMTRGLEHNVVVVPITNAQDIGGHAVAGAGQREISHCTLVLQFTRILFRQPFGNGTILEGTSQPVLHLDFAQSFRLVDELNHAALVSRGHTVEGDHFQVQALSQPHFVHDAYQLNGQLILLQVIAALQRTIYEI